MLVENRDFFIPHLHWTPPLGGRRRNVAITFGAEKLERSGDQTVKKYENMFARFDTTNERDGQTDGRTDEHRTKV